MRCPYCQCEDHKVTDSRDAHEQGAIRRRRECANCLRRFTTFETIELTLQVHKRDGRFEDFQLQKLISGMDAACRHTTVSHEEVTVFAALINSELIQRQLRTITTTELGEMVMKHLEERDPIAYIRFACEYKRFKKIDDLMDAIQAIQPKDEAKSKKARNSEEATDGAQKS